MSESAVLVLVLVLVGAAAAVTVTVRVMFKNKSQNNSRKTVQKGNVVGGDQAGGDVHKDS
jgi:NADH:ubiquinone oxidoreductase subunit 6 (subunit J)